MTAMTTLSVWMVPILIAIILLHASYKKIPSYEIFVAGGKEGIKLAVSIMPFLVGMLTAIGVFRASGAMDGLANLLRPLLSFVGMPPEVVPLAILRPISGNGALGLMSELIKTYGPDSYIGRLASVMQGSTDTTFYVVTVYFGAVGIRRIGDALKVGLLADAVGVCCAVAIVTMIFGK
ncbi:spore maturation protein [Sporolactobacillus spathodeae]|uniref:Spore maturation protein B n=1 Tax=Sporolactobacillus spathodeae TaxID=1465502 RepID=A0ABS2Q7S4_9BACL|nr:spore maturation protein [Sporolactobacillus spathodeae]MBM7657844.1 spore maturation protein B [Sporolactobacillus spathodeae]